MEEVQTCELIALRDDILDSVTKIYDFVKGASVTQYNAAYAKHKRLAALIHEHAAIHRNIVRHNANCEDNEQKVAVLKDQFDDIVDATELSMHKLKEKVAAKQDRSSDPSVNQTSGSSTYKPKLPPIKIPSFKGTISHWAEFIASYDSLIHNNSAMNSVEKFHQLRSLLEGDPLSLISHFTISDANYPLAYRKLRDRYQNDRVLATHYANEFINYKPVPLLNNLTSLEQYYSAHNDSVKRLVSLALNDDFDFLCFHISYNHLDRRLQERFDETHAPDAVHTHADLMQFVQTYIRSVELHQFSNLSLGTKPPVSSTRAASRPSRAKPSALMSRATPPAASNVPAVSIKYPCPKCSEAHFLSACPAFVASSAQDKLDFLCAQGRCHVCMGKHATTACRSRYICPVCKGKHHNLLHGAAAASSDAPPPTSLAVSSQVYCKPNQVLLTTVMVYIKDVFNSFHSVRALLDSCSEISAITTCCAKRLGLPISRQASAIHGIGQSPAVAKGITHLAVHSRLNPSFSVHVSAYLMDQIAAPIPSQPIPASVQKQFQHLPLADPDWCNPREIDLLLGADIYSSVLTATPPLLGSITAIPTLFGHVLMGHVTQSDPAVPKAFLTLQPSLEEALLQFWKSEEINSPPLVKPEDSLAEQLFSEGHLRTSEGRFMVPMLFRQLPVLGNNRNVALRSYLSLERRLKLHPERFQSYSDFMREYLQLGHMALTSSPSNYIIPHHVVYKLSSSTTKTRVVFNASASSDLGCSLNDFLLPGPKLQSDITQILLSFRLHRVALCGDIRMMYRQIQVLPSDCVHQHILWRPEPCSPVSEYELRTVTYGLTSSAFLAQRCIAQLSADHAEQFPLAASALRSEVYVDDVTSGSTSIASAISLRDQLISLLALGGFELRKWMSNEPSVLAGLPPEHIEANLTFEGDDSSIKILGLSWDPRSDSFKYTVEPFSLPYTKRNILSYLARTFDPMGWLAPVVVWIKCFLQRLWLNNLDWDELIPLENSALWRMFSESLPILSDVRIPRFLSVLPTAVISLVGFSDASSSAFSACIYLHAVSATQTTCMLIQAKSKVAPLKTQSIARLELNGSLLLSRLARTIINNNSNLFSSVHLFTDSENVLHWIHGSPHQYKTYVANRVSKIHDLIGTAIWRYVSTHDNPADCASRGQFPAEFSSNSLWWTGPSFLLQPIASWPSWGSSGPNLDDPEQKALPTSLVAQPNALLDQFSRHSSFTRLLRIVSYVFRFLNLCRGLPVRNGPPSSIELDCALFNIIRVVQRHEFAADFASIRTSSCSTSRLRSLTPFVDDNYGLLRVGGRLGLSMLPYERVHPPILPKSSFLSTLIVEHYHLISCHSGPTMVQALIHRRFWIISARALVRSVLRKCVRCIRARPKSATPLMGSLPPSRVLPSPPFAVTGTDFAGPFLLKESHRRNASCSKAYLCVFVCSVTKAVHLELVTSLTTDAFLAALDRFTSRRGLPSELFSDCGRTFVSANRRLTEVSTFLSSKRDLIFSACSLKGVHWSFNPPYASNFGGLFEAVVKSTKRLLFKSLGDSHYYHEELSTFFARIEGILNSRPLVPLPVESDADSDFLTPGHFLIGRPLLGAPEMPLDLDTPLLCRWQNLRRITQFFWRRFSTEYLNLLIPRRKWQVPTPSLTLDQVVLVPDIHCTPMSWPLGRVIKLHPGSDGHVRVATVLCRGREYVRPANKLVPLLAPS